ncbi:methyltransferase [Porticoccaceae bacterium LTM1]|nr:methyltransferase [Porticoccaceae bacterium LTM1]
METLTTPFGSLALARYPRRKRETLRAWDAADEYLLEHIQQEDLLTSTRRILILNDTFGALAVSLCKGSNKEIASVSDSWLAHQGCKANLAGNNLDAEAVSLHSSLDWPEGAFDLVLIKVPKTSSLLEDQLYRLREHLDSKSVVLAAGMAKGIHTSTLKQFEQLIGETRTSLAKKKARLIFVEPDLSKNVDKENPYPISYFLDGYDFQIHNHANVFSREKLDIGTRFFLEHIPGIDEPRQIIDLGCGNGLVGIVAARKNPSSTITFVDESFMAVESAKLNFESSFPNRNANFQVTDCLAGIAPDSADLILNNPPFHQQHAVGDHIAMQMFEESKKVLKQHGELWVIGNRHLGYHVKLKRLFGNCQTVASNPKFVILKAFKR